MKEKEENVPEFTKKNLFYKYYMTKFINFTLVLHPVGRHYDTFLNNKSSYENRVCFCLDKIDNRRTDESLSNKYGRGGCGINNFCFALLDW